MIHVQIQMKATAPDDLATPARQQEVINAIEALVQDAFGFDNTDTILNQTGNVTLPGTIIYQLLEGLIRVGRNGLSVCSTITERGGDPAELRTASRHGASFIGFSALRSDLVEELLAFILVRPMESMQHLGDQNRFSDMQLWFRDPTRSQLNDDRQFGKAVWIDRDGFHFNVPIWLHGMSVMGAIGVTMPPGLTLSADVPDETQDRALLRGVLERMQPTKKGQI